MVLISEVRAELITHLQKINTAIGILRSARETDQPVTHEQVSFIDNLELIHSPEGFSLMLESKSIKRNQKLASHGETSERYEPILLTKSEDIENFCKFLAGMPLNISFHFDLILAPGNVHGSALQVSSDGQTVQSYYLESLSDINKIEKQAIFNAAGSTNHTYQSGKLLSAEYGCKIFSLQHLNSMNRFIKKGEYLPKGEVNFNDLDPVFVKHGQRLTVIKKYLEDNYGKELFVDKKKSITLQDHLDNFSLTVEIIKDGKIELKKRNFSLLNKTKKYLESSLTLLESLENDETKLQEILYRRSVNPILTSIYQGMNLTQEQIQLAEGLYNSDQITLLLDYKIPKALLEDAACFKTKEMSKLVLSYIKEFSKYNPEIALNIFNQVKDCQNIYQAKAILVNKIPKEEIISLSTLKDLNKAPYVLNFIERWQLEKGIKGVDVALSTIKFQENGGNAIPQDVLMNLDKLNQDQFLAYAIFLQSTKLIKKWVNAGANINSLAFSFIDNAIETNNPNVISEIILAGPKITSKAATYITENFSQEYLQHILKIAIDEDKVNVVNNIIKICPKIITYPIDGRNPIDYIMSTDKPKLLSSFMSKLGAEENINISPNIARIASMSIGAGIEPRGLMDDFKSTSEKEKPDQAAVEVSPGKRQRKDIDDRIFYQDDIKSRDLVIGPKYSLARKPGKLILGR